jgi:phosphocarrier protein
MIERTFAITYPHGLHARPATMLVGKAAQFDATIDLEYRQNRVNMKSIMGVLSLGVPENTTFKVIIHGMDEEAAMEAISLVITLINQLA